MKDSVLREVIKDSLEKKLPNLINREIEIPLNINIKRAISIIGPRRSGKTYYMFQLMKNISEEERLYINFEDYRLEKIDYKTLARMIEIYYQMFPENKKRKVYFFFDEIQNVIGWEKIIRHLLDNENCQVFLTGSSSKLLSKEIATQLRGRTISYMLLPFSFREFLKAKNFEISQYLSSYQKAKLMKYLETYMKFGGYPEAVLFNEKEKIIDEIWEVTIARDIMERWQIRNIKLLKLLIKALKESKIFSVHKFYNYLKSLGMKVSKNTLYEYIEYLKDSMVLFTLHRYSPSYKNTEKSLPKTYFVDTGLYQYSWNLSRSLENIVFLELLRKGKKTCYYYITKSGQEIDFYLSPENTLIEVTYDYDQEHLQKIVKAMKEVKAKKCLIITWDYEGEEIVNRKRIKLIPLWKWLYFSKKNLFKT